MSLFKDYRVRGWQRAKHCYRDCLGQQSAGDERAKDVIVDIGRSDPHLSDLPVGVLLADVVATGEDR